MEQKKQIWQTWADTLNRWGLKTLTATFLEALGPLNLFGAQIVYLGQPLLNSFLPESHLNALAELLENPQTTQAFIAVLRQPDSPASA
ncbi:MAG TPA: hypothetical protein DEH22_08865 [Chloroflexi bacterium]|nr:hypothetical protein [Chloroflexota bacterium]